LGAVGDDSQKRRAFGGTYNGAAEILIRAVGEVLVAAYPAAPVRPALAALGSRGRSRGGCGEAREEKEGRGVE
jgi:hypothetical protein